MSGRLLSGRGIAMEGGVVSGELPLVALSALEMLFPPLAGPVLPLAGAAVSRSEMALLPAIVFAVVGSTVGSSLLYLGSRWFGAERVRSALLRSSRWSRLSVDHFDRAERWFERNAVFAVSAGRCVPVVRSLVSIPAGLVRMPFGRFVALSAIGNTVWCAGIILVASRLSERSDAVQDVAGFLQLIVIVVWVVVIAVAFVVWLLRRRSTLTEPIDDDQAAGLHTNERERDKQ